jgi:hypothetical protein
LAAAFAASLAGVIGVCVRNSTPCTTISLGHVTMPVILQLNIFFPSRGNLTAELSSGVLKSN